MHNIYRRTRSDDDGYGTCLAMSLTYFAARTGPLARENSFLNFHHRNTILRQYYHSADVVTWGSKRSIFGKRGFVYT